MLNGSENVAIFGSHNVFTVKNLNDDRINEGLKILYQHAAPGALHNSGERLDPPNCHPETRVQVREKIMAWLNDRKSDALPVMWLNGPMGAGKSSIGQAIAELCHKEGQLAGSFFFAHASPDRNTEKAIVATLAYQMSKEIPQIRPYISVAILKDPLIFESSLNSQIDALIINPLSSLVLEAPCKPRIIIIDGLDECVNFKAQAIIVKAFVESIAYHTERQEELPVSLKILIISCPETNIEEAFSLSLLSASVRRLSLNAMWKPDDDIMRFLIDGFEKIRRSHPAKEDLPADWPSIT